MCTLVGTQNGIFIKYLLEIFTTIGSDGVCNLILSFFLNYNTKVKRNFKRNGQFNVSKYAGIQFAKMDPSWNVQV